jgi:peptidyl-prolyl cis-trans isomerase SurA
MKNFLLIILTCFIFNKSNAIETVIIHIIQNEIITNVDIKNEFKYLVALNNSLKELDKEKILKISNESIIRERIKKIEISKNFEKMSISEEYSNFKLKNIYKRLELESIEELELYLKDYNLTLNDLRKKIVIDSLWNQLIIEKYEDQITINKEKIKQEILKKNKKQSKEYHLAEIIFNIKNKNEIKKKYQEIFKSINQIGFKNSASIYSISDTAKTGGDIGWVNEDSLNSTINNQIKNLKINEISRPIVLPTGILILKMKDIKNIKIKINVEVKLEEAINYERNRQFSQFSKIYYNKVKKNLEFNE